MNVDRQEISVDHADVLQSFKAFENLVLQEGDFVRNTVHELLMQELQALGQRGKNRIKPYAMDSLKIVAYEGLIQGRLNRATESSVDRSGVFQLLQILSSEKLWLAFLVKTREKDEDLYKQLSTLLRTDPEDMQAVAAQITFRNKRFFSIALAFFGIAALMGSDFNTVIQKDVALYHSALYGCAQMASTFDNGVVHSTTEVLDRLKTMFSVQPHTGKTFVQQYLDLENPDTGLDAFQRSKDGKLRYCPMRDLTEELCVSFGEFLANDTNRKALETAVNTPRR